MEIRATDSRGPMTRVDHSHPCPKCGRDRLCTYRHLGGGRTRVNCTSEAPSAGGKPCKGGIAPAWSHILEDDHQAPTPEPRHRHVEAIPLATAEARDRVY